MKSSAHNSFLERLERNKPEDTLAMRDSVVVMLDSPGWAFVNDLLEQRIESIRARMGLDTIYGRAEYAGMVAEIRGLEAVTAAAEAIEEAANRAEQALELAVGLAAGDSA